MLAKTLAGLRVLVVEDEALLAEELFQRLKRLGLFPLEVVDTGLKAIEAAFKHLPDLILMDVRLKGPLDGIEAVDAISREISVPTVFLTAHSDVETMRRAKAVEPYGYVLKPFNERDLIITLEMAILRHGLDRKLRASEKRFAATLASIADGVISVDRDGFVTFMNRVAEKLTGWRLEESLRLPIEEVFTLVDESTGSPLPNPLREALLNRKIVRPSLQTLLLSRSGEKILVEDSAAPIRGDGSENFGAVIAFQDVRSRRQADDQLRKAQEQLQVAQRMETVGHLSGGLAHDFNNLLTVISCHAELLMYEELSPSAQELVDEIIRAGAHGASITRQLLSFCRQGVVQPASLNLRELFNEVGVILARLLGQNIVLSIQYDQDLRPFLADPGQIEQVLLNLAINARDAMPNGGYLTLEAVNVAIEGREFIKLLVQDSGPGIDELHLKRIFEPFFTTKEASLGSGLGLATVQAIVKQCHGHLEVTSVLGEGTKFELFFPALSTPASLDENAQQRARPQPSLGSEAVLVVDDQKTVRDSVSKGLAYHGYAVYSAGSGREGEEMFRERMEEIQILISDIEMPEMSGRELAARLRGLKPNLKVLFLSGHTRDELLRKRHLADREHFLQKPFSLAALTGKVRELADQG